MKNKLEKEWINIIFNTIFAVLTISIVIFVHKKILLTTILLIIVAIIGLVKWKSKLTLLIFIFGAIFGTLSEMIVINYGVWNYTIKNIFNVPLWLFIVWGNAAALVYQTAIEFRKLGVRK